jgi:hypothetical protein
MPDASRSVVIKPFPQRLPDWLTIGILAAFGSGGSGRLDSDDLSFESLIDLVIDRRPDLIPLLYRQNAGLLELADGREQFAVEPEQGIDLDDFKRMAVGFANAVGGCGCEWFSLEAADGRRSLVAVFLMHRDPGA